MKYDKDEIYDQALEAIGKNRWIHFMDDVIAHVDCQKTTFYTLFPEGSNELNDIRNAVNQNRIRTKSELRKNMYDEGKQGNLYLYKLLADDHERDALSMNKVEHSGQVKVAQVNISDDQLDQLMGGKEV